MPKEERYKKIDYRGNWNIGAFGLATDKFAIFGYGFREGVINAARKALEVPVIIEKSLFDSLVGSMTVANSRAILLPDKGTTEKGVNNLEKQFQDHELDVTVTKIRLKKHYNALGNIALALDNHFITHSRIINQNKKLLPIIEETMGAEVVGYDFPVKVPGSALVGNGRGLLGHPMIKDQTLTSISEDLNLKVGKGSVNFGSPWVGNGFILNSHGLLAGNKTTGYEMAKIWEVLFRK